MWIAYSCAGAAVCLGGFCLPPRPVILIGGPVSIGVFHPAEISCFVIGVGGGSGRRILHPDQTVCPVIGIGCFCSGGVFLPDGTSPLIVSALYAASIGIGGLYPVPGFVVFVGGGISPGICYPGQEKLNDNNPNINVLLQ